MQDYVVEIVVAIATVLGTIFAGMQVFKPSKVPVRLKEASDWRDACSDNTPEAYQAFVDKWSDGPHATEAKTCLENLTKGLTQVTVGTGAGDDQKYWLGPGDWFCDFDGGPEMVVIPPGSFLMGTEGDIEPNEWGADERPRHEVQFTTPFAVGRYLVTFDEWEVFDTATNTRRAIEDEGWGAGRRPIIKVPWVRAHAFVDWLSRETEKPYRLLSEAEWEYCCRAGTQTEYSTGDLITRRQACYARDRSEEVGTYGPNSFGLHDLHGNVWEWCADLWHENYISAPADGSAWLTCGERNRVVRGGSWEDLDDEEPEQPWYLRSAVRYGYAPGTRSWAIGFRVARDL